MQSYTFSSKYHAHDRLKMQKYLKIRMHFPKRVAAESVVLLFPTAVKKAKVLRSITFHLPHNNQISFSAAVQRSGASYRLSGETKPMLFC